MAIFPIVIALLIFIVAILLTTTDLLTGFLFFVLLTPLLHKELFSLVVWDFLPVRIVFLGLILVTTYRFIIWFKKHDKKESLDKIKTFLLKDPIFILLFLLWIVRLISIIWSQSLDDSIKLMAFYTSIVYIYVFMKVLWQMHGVRFIDKTINVYSVVGVLTGLFAFVQLYLRQCCRETVGGIWVIPGHLPRLGSSFWDVNHYGGFLAMLIPIMFASIFARKAVKWKVFMTLLTAFLLVVLLLTGSRSALIGLMLGMAISIILYYWMHLKRPLIVLTVIFLLGITSLLGYTKMRDISIRDKVASYMHYRLDSTDTHFLLIEGAGEVFLDNLVIGSGYGDFDPAFRLTKTADEYFGREPSLSKVKVPPHSIWGEVLAETGGVGIVLYSSIIILLVSSLIAAIRHVKEDREKYLGIGLLGGILSIVISGIFYSYNLEFFWIVLFLGVAYSAISLGKDYNLSYLVGWWIKRPITPYLIILLPSIFYIFIRLGSTTLIDWDEAIYAKVAKNIVQSGDWLNLKWESLDKNWFEKPPLYMWMTALVYKITGFNSFGARFVSGLFGVLSILMTYKLGSKLYNKFTGIAAALILLSTVHFLYYSRNGMLDVTVTFFIVSTLFFFYSGIEELKTKRKVMLFTFAGVMLGLGVMTKAVIGMLPIPVMILYLIYAWRYTKNSPKIKYLLFMVIAFLAVAVPWHAYSIKTHGSDFIDEYFLNHILSRGFEGFGHERPLWWFLEVIKVSFRIWIFPLIIGVFALPFIDKEKKQYVLVMLTAFITLVFFSVSKDKLIWYIVPIYPFLAIIAARLMERGFTIGNSMLKTDLRLSNEAIRLVGIFSVIIVSLFYVVIERDMVYLDDFNKDKVALVKINNAMYPIEDNEDKKLYYNNISPPILLFYSDHQIDGVNIDKMLDVIDDSEPGQSQMFLIPEKLYYDVKTRQSEIEAPLVLELKGNAGGWTLVKSRSRVELLREKHSNLVMQVNPLKEKLLLKTITRAERGNLKGLTEQLDEVLAQLSAYGYGPN